VMHILPEDVDLLQEHDILLHDSSVLLLVHILVLLQHLPQIVDAILQVFPPVCVLSVDVEIPRVVLELFLHVFLVQVDGPRTQLFVVYDLSANIQNILFKFLLK